MAAKKRSETAREKPGVNGSVKTRSGLTTTAADRARARDLRATRVDHIISLMTRGQWQGLRSHRALAKKWEASVHSVADYAREANSIIRHAVSGDIDVIRTEILTGIHRVREVAMRLTRPMLVAKEVYDFVSTPDVGAALRSYELQAKMLGLFPSEPTHERKPEDMKPAEHLAELGRLKAEIEVEEKRLAEQAGAGGTLQ